MIKPIFKGPKARIVIMTILLAAACWLTYYFHVVIGTGVVFTYFFYIPIILASLWWKRKGLLVAVFLAALLIISHNILRGDVLTANDYLRAAMFIVIAFVVAMLSERMAKAEEYSENLEQMVEERTKHLRDAQEHLLLSERLATLGQFSGGISHELRNPLGVIGSSAYYLKTKLKDADKKVHEHLDRIKSSVGSASAIIESLLNLTRMKEPKLAILDLIAIAHDAIVTSKLPDTVNIIQDFPEQEVSVNADREQLHMAFQNIVTNAVEAMDGKGTLTVTVHMATDGQAEVSFADTGPGIAPQDTDRVFQPLFSTKAKGIGFGLSIAKMIIDKHGGTIEAKSEARRGATIITRLPLYTDKDKEV